VGIGARHLLPFPFDVCGSVYACAGIPFSIDPYQTSFIVIHNGAIGLVWAIYWFQIFPKFYLGVILTSTNRVRFSNGTKSVLRIYLRNLRKVWKIGAVFLARTVGYELPTAHFITRYGNDLNNNARKNLIMWTMMAGGAFGDRVVIWIQQPTTRT